MAEDPIAQGEIAALTRRYENALQIVRGDIAAVDNRLMTVEEKLDGFIAEQREATAVTGRRLDGLEQKINGFIAEQRSVNTTLVELLSALTGKNPDAS
ncbi:hypothetical protein [Streptomyces tsukubensis]|uniref:hypothetical protein n=1 Tax=Streptomyces tsukubensis TaxID=83656 RepID=UPI003450E6D6